jgi:hypothetical protein
MATTRKSTNEQDRMTTAERIELAKVVRMRFRVVRNDLEQQKAQHLAEFERQVAHEYKVDEAAWADITARAKAVVLKADAEIAKICREHNIPEAFRPGLSLGWYKRGENAHQERRTELRRVAQTMLDARAKAAKVEADRREADILTGLAARGLGTAEAHAFLDQLPKIDQLMPKLRLAEVEKQLPLGTGEDPDLD